MNLKSEYSKLKIEIYVPEEFIDVLRDELTSVGACKVGNYDAVTSYSLVKGTWRPLKESNPYSGQIDEICHGTEYKMEIRCDKNIAEKVIAVIKKVHPYETPLINVIPLINHEFGLE